MELAFTRIFCINDFQLNVFDKPTEIRRSFQTEA